MSEAAVWYPHYTRLDGFCTQKGLLNLLLYSFIFNLGPNLDSLMRYYYFRCFSQICRTILLEIFSTIWLLSFNIIIDFSFVPPESLCKNKQGNYFREIKMFWLLLCCHRFCWKKYNCIYMSHQEAQCTFTGDPSSFLMETIVFCNNQHELQTV